MRIISVTEGRKQLGELINLVKYQHRVIALGKNGKADALQFPMMTPRQHAVKRAKSGSYAQHQAQAQNGFLSDGNVFGEAGAKPVR